MKRILLGCAIILLGLSAAKAQTRSDACHVYVVDVALGRKAIDRFMASEESEAAAKASTAGQTVLPQFKPLMGEEKLTTKTYRFPQSKLFISASVYYTDESMASAVGVDSMLVGLAISPKAQRDAISAENNAVAEVTVNDHQDTVRVKKYVKMNRRLYLVGLECHCKERPKSD